SAVKGALNFGGNSLAYRYTASIDYSHVASLVVNAANNGTAATVSITGALPAATLNLGKGDDTVNVTGASQSGYALTVDGGPGHNVLNVLGGAGAQFYNQPSGPSSGRLTLTYPTGGRTSSITYSNVQSPTWTGAGVSLKAPVQLRVGLARVQLTAETVPTVNHATRHYVQRVALQNVSKHALRGPVWLVLDHLSAGARLVNAVTTGGQHGAHSHPYILVSRNGLKAGKLLQLNLVFAGHPGVHTSYLPRLVTGHAPA